MRGQNQKQNREERTAVVFLLDGLLLTGDEPERGAALNEREGSDRSRGRASEQERSDSLLTQTHAEGVRLGFRELALCVGRSVHKL